MTTPPPGQALRADARRNYERVLQAARVVFAEQGVEVPIDEIARRAGVGNATLYRRFPTRQALLEAVHRDQIDAMSARARQLLTASSPGEALATWLRELVSQGSTSRSLTTALMVALQSAGSDVSWCRETMLAAATSLLNRAQQAGAINGHITAGQVLKLANAVALASEGEPDQERQAEELLTVVLNGLRRPPTVA
jgi:AcrR family transcriptional regulator